MSGNTDPPPYELLDFGDNRKLERFGSRVVQRESPSVGWAMPSLRSWESDLVFESKTWSGPVPEPWSFRMSDIEFELRATPTGQVGVFPEQQFNWDWIAARGEAVQGKRAINLFGYTGGATIALAKQGVHVTHVDSAKSVVLWARKNAASNGLQDKPIRWIVDDAVSFMQREIRRQNDYDIVIADPPSFGRGTKKQTWKFDRDFDNLMDLVLKLCPRPVMIILSCHTPGWGGNELQRALKGMYDFTSPDVEAGDLMLDCADGRALASGCFARFFRK